MECAVGLCGWPGVGCLRSSQTSPATLWCLLSFSAALARCSRNCDYDQHYSDRLFAIFGVDINLGWYEHCVGPFLGRVVPADNNQSIDGFLIRLTTGTDYFSYSYPVEPTTIHETFRILLFAGVFGGIFCLLRKTDGVETATGVGVLVREHFLEYVLVLVLSRVMSPLSWTHYYLFLLLPWGLYLGGRLSLRDDVCTRCFMWSGILLSLLPVSYVLNFLLSRTAASAWLFGGLCMLAAYDAEILADVR